MPISKTLPKELSWKAQNRNQPERSPAWYLGFGLIALGCLAFAIFYDRSLLTIITFVLMILIVLGLSFVQGRETTYRLTSQGISAGRLLYPYKTIKKFWLDYRPPEIKTLNFETTAYINNKIGIELGHQDPVMVKLFLSQYVREDLDHEESATEALARRLKI